MNKTNNRKKRTPIPGHVYVLESCDGKSVKIGRSKNPEKRVHTLRNSSNSNGRCFISVLQEDSSFLEQTCHKEFHIKRMKGEWFSISFDEAVLFVNSNLKPVSNKNCISIHAKEKEQKYMGLFDKLFTSPKPVNSEQPVTIPNFVNLTVEDRKEAYLSVCKDVLENNVRLIETNAQLEISELKIKFYNEILEPLGMT